MSSASLKQSLNCVCVCGGEGTVGREPWRTVGGRGAETGEGRVEGRAAAEKLKKASFRYLLRLTSSQRNEPNNVP